MRIEDVYQNIADNINSSQDRGGDIVSHIDQMMTDINDSEIPVDDTNKEKLESQINATSKLLTLKCNVYTTQILNFVKKLQKYITDQYGSVNTFLRDHVMQVGAIFADISATVGYPIDPENIIGYYGADFYVSNIGDDSNDGRTVSTSWATLDKVGDALADSTIGEGDIVGFRTDDTFVGTLDTSEVDGSSGSPIIFTSYGSGDKPLITGKVALGDNWVHHSGNIWRYDVSSLSTDRIRYLLLNGVNQTMAQSEAGYADSSTTSSFQDYNLSNNPSFNPSADPDYNPSDYDDIYVGAEVLMRITSYQWSIRIVTDYDSFSGNISYAPSTYTSLTQGSGGGVSGYLFQNCLYILEQNATQDEWVNEGDYIYYYSTTDPYDLGTIEVSSIDTLMEIENSEYITVDNLKFTYANYYAIFGGGSNYKNITNCDFERCALGVYERDIVSTDSTIDNNIFLDMGGTCVLQYRPTNLTVTNNIMTNIGLEIGRTPYVLAEKVYDSITYTADSNLYVGVFAAEEKGGTYKYNNMTNIGYKGFYFFNPFPDPTLVQYNYVENPCLIGVDGGAYYVYSEVDTTSSNINKITLSNNIAVYNAYDNLDYQIAYRAGRAYWGCYGLYKDGYIRATNWYDNFAFGFQIAFMCNPTQYSEFKRNIAVNRHYVTGDGSDRAFKWSDLVDGTVPWRNNIVTNNTLISNYVGSARVGLMYGSQLDADSGNSIDYNKMLQPFSAAADLFYDIENTDSLTLDEWKASEVVGIHETSTLFLYSISGLAAEADFIWYAINPTKETVGVSFPTGYRYYTVDGDVVTSDALTLYEGKVYYRTINEGMPQASNVIIISDTTNPSVGENYNASYTYSHEEGNAESGSTYQWYRSTDGNIEGRVEIPGETSLTHTTTVEDGGQYVLFGVIPKSVAGAGSLVTGVERFSASSYIDFFHYLNFYEHRSHSGDDVPKPEGLVDYISGLYSYKSLLYYKYTSFKDMSYYYSVSRTSVLIDQYITTLTDDEIDDIFNEYAVAGRVVMGILQKADIEKIYDENISAGASPSFDDLLLGIEVGSDGVPVLDDDNKLISDPSYIALEDYQQGRTIVTPTQYWYTAAYWLRPNFNFNTPAVQEYCVRVMLNTLSLCKDHAIFVDNITISIMQIYDDPPLNTIELNYISPGTLLQQTELYTNQCVDIINEAVDRSERPPLVQTNGWFYGTPGTYKEAFTDTLRANLDDIDGVMAENGFLTDSQVIQVQWWLDWVADTRVEGKKAIFSVAYAAMSGLNDPYIYRAWLWLHLIADDNVYVYINDAYNQPMKDLWVFDYPLGSPLGRARLDGDIWYRAYERGTIYFDISSGQLEGAISFVEGENVS